LSVHRATAEALNIFGFVKLPLSLGLMNYSALARRIRPIVEEKLQRGASPGAVTIAVQRQARALAREKTTRLLVEMIARSRIGITTGLVLMYFEKSRRMKGEFLRMYEKIRADPDKKIDVTFHDDEIMALTGWSALQSLSKLLAHSPPSFRLDNRSLIRLTRPKHLDSPGYLNYFLNELTARGVNIDSLFITRATVCFVVSDEQAADAYEGIASMIEKCSKMLEAA
jgi:hypothetical protein